MTLLQCHILLSAVIDGEAWDEHQAWLASVPEELYSV